MAYQNKKDRKKVSILKQMDRRVRPSRKPGLTQQPATEAQFDLYLALAQAYDEQPDVTRKSEHNK